MSQSSIIVTLITFSPGSIESKHPKVSSINSGLISTLVPRPSALKSAYAFSTLKPSIESFSVLGVQPTDNTALSS